ncbi:MAG: rane fusion protein copper/silver efflux system [Betaproteobacteria bacterium]|jgi:Cu(I)/Ag(I) efflux system membrane fusion protein|nr:rane fusion protein copper/silver efflux system [Betaproteobacteria bacterium]
MRKALLGVAAVVVLGAGGYGLYYVGTQHPTSAAPEKAGRRILYWHDPMVPGQRFDKPGKSPFMDMQLVPVYEDEQPAGGGVAVDPRMQQSLGMRTAEVVRERLAPSVEAAGSVAYNERDTALVQARASGFVERLHVRATLDQVRKGQPLADLYVPDWVAAQEEYLSARRMAGTRMEGLIDGARQRMRLAGMSDAQIATVESTGKVQARLTITAPISGVVAELGAREGMTVMPGAALFRISGLGTVWVNAEVRESEAGAVRVGNAVEARTPALPGRVFKGRVSAILPEVSATTRTLKARVELANPAGELKPGMFATVNFTPAARGEVLAVPSEAVIQTGKRSVVIVAQAEGRFAPVEVETGIEANGRTEIRSGLEGGQKVVVSGQFLIDSEASLRAAETRMGAAVHKGTGKVRAVDAPSGYLELDHDPIPSMQWPQMIMAFQAENKAELRSLKEGDRVQFEVLPAPDKDGNWILRKIEVKP